MSPAHGEDHSPSLPTDARRAGMRRAYLAQAIGLPLTVLLTEKSVGPLFIKALGGTDFQAMLLSSFFGLFIVLQIPTSLRVTPTRGKRFMLRMFLLAGAAAGVAAILPSFLPTGAGPTWIVLLFLCAFTASRAVGSTFWFPLLHDVVPSNARGRFFGNLRFVWNMSVYGCVVAAGVFLGADPPLWKYQVVLGVALAGHFLRNVIIARIPQPSQHAERSDGFSDWQGHLRTLVRRREVLVFCLYLSTLVFCAGFLQQPMVLYLEHLGFDTSENVVIYGFTTLGSALAFLGAGFLVDHLGTKRTFLLAHLSLCALALIVVTSHGLAPAARKPLLMAVFVITGGAVALTSVAATTQLFHLAPLRGRAFFFGVTTMVAVTGRSLAYLTAGGVLALVPRGWSMPIGGSLYNVYEVVFALAGLGLLGGTLLLYFIHDVRRPHADRTDP